MACCLGHAPAAFCRRHRPIALLVTASRQVVVASPYLYLTKPSERGFKSKLDVITVFDARTGTDRIGTATAIADMCVFGDNPAPTTVDGLRLIERLL